MRRLIWLAPLLLALALLATPATAAADTGDLVLAAEAEDGEELGPTPQPLDDPDNPARSLAGYDDPEIPFHWAASFLLLGLAVTGVVVGGALWYLLVLRPSKLQGAGGS